MKHNWIKTLYCFLLTAFMMVSLVPTTVYAAPDTEETNEEETVLPEDTIYISSSEDLLALAENCMDDDWSIGKTVVLQNDIDLTDVDFYGIPTFSGTFYGNGHSIKGWSVKYERSVVGFFRYTQSKAIIDDLHIEGTVQPEGSAKVVGTIVGCNGGTIKNCTFSGIVSGKEIIGGIVGLNKASSIIENCTVNGKVYGNHYIGGIVGENKGVVRHCTNLAEVNAEVDHNSLGMSMELTVEGITSKESVDTATNIGGIAGTSTGVIRECENQANVGYKKMGHNVGGIVGSQNGYVVDCKNHGKVEGSDGVGGIAGQFKPNILLEFGPDPIETMNNKMNAMMNSMNDLTNSIGQLESSLDDGSFAMDTEMNDMKDALDSLENSKDPETGEYDEDVLDSVLNDFSNSVDEMHQEGAELENNAEALGISSKLESVMSQMEDMMDFMDESMSISTEINIEDVSRYDKETDTIGKITGCINYGEIAGENGVAGIAGNCDSEMLPSEEDIDTQGKESMDISASIRLVLRDCKNFGTISASKGYVGGIVGQMAQGAIINCANAGNLDALAANYVGGIAGNCDTYISGCFVKSILAGADYVGGIAGCAVEVSDCYSLVDIAAGTEYVGCIIGGMENLPDTESSLVSENYYYHVGTDRGGIDGINYKGATSRISFEEYLALENLDEMFKTVSVTFVIEGQDDVVKTLSLGDTLALDAVPVLSVDDDQMYDWVYVKPVTSETLSMNETEEIFYLSKNRLTAILFDQLYEAEFEAKHMVSQGEDKTEDGYSVILAIGAFDKNTTITLTDMLAKESILNEVTLKENWEVAISNIGVEKLHYRIPAGMKSDAISLFVKDASGTWTEREYMVEGSYMIFDFSENETGFALAEDAGNNLYFAIILIVAILVIVGLFIIRKRKSCKKG